MTRARYFGTDGIRGKAGEGKLSERSLERLAHAIGAHFGHGAKAVIGQDTRRSGDDLRAALSRGLMHQGVDVATLGILPTPATAMMVPECRADLGLMITASHNPWFDNGVKLFGRDGRKISDADQDAIETLIDRALADDIAPAATPGRDTGAVSADTLYVDALVEAYRAVGGRPLGDLRIVADCANGAAYQVFPAALRALGAEPVLLGVDPNGRNINADCGSTHPDALSRAVLDHSADIGIALDGDADRLILVDKQGKVVDGDQIIARLATDWQAQGRLQGSAVVSTVMSNMGLERYLEALGLTLARTPVGDRHVAARMQAIGANLGGEPSGHLLMTDHALTGDGSLAALMLLAGLQHSEQDSADYLKLFDPFPQQLRNVRYDGVSPMTREAVRDAVARTDARLGEKGRVLVRASGTEPVIRVMVEAEDVRVVSATVDELCAVIASAVD